MSPKVHEDFKITDKAPTRAFSWLKAPTSAFTFKALLGAFSVIVKSTRTFAYIVFISSSSLLVFTSIGRYCSGE